MSAALCHRTHMNTAQNVRPARHALLFVPLLLVILFLASALRYSRADETNTPAAPPFKSEDATNTAAVLRSYLHLQEQLQAAQLAMERNRKEAETFAARNTEAIAARLQHIEQAMSAQRARDQETVQSANRLLLIVAGSFAGVGFLAM